MDPFKNCVSSELRAYITLVFLDTNFFIPIHSCLNFVKEFVRNSFWMTKGQSIFWRLEEPDIASDPKFIFWGFEYEDIDSNVCGYRYKPSKTFLLLLFSQKCLVIYADSIYTTTTWERTTFTLETFTDESRTDEFEEMLTQPSTILKQFIETCYQMENANGFAFDFDDDSVS